MKHSYEGKVNPGENIIDLPHPLDDLNEPGKNIVDGQLEITE